MEATLITLRNHYNTPPTGLTFTTTDAKNKNQPYQAHQFKTTLELDYHHHHLLRSTDRQEVLLGLYSVIYWIQNSTENNAITPSPELLSPVITNMGAASAARIVQNSVDDLDHKNHAHALIEISKLLHGRLTLCTTFLSFIDPENVAIFDNQITQHLTTAHYNNFVTDETKNAITRPASENLQEAAARFSLYCRILKKIKTAVNQQRTGWLDSSGCQMSRFRVIDIERALRLRITTDA